MEPTTIALIILLFVVVLYITELIPLAMTAVGGCFAMALFKVADFSDAFSGFSASVVFLVGGMMAVGLALFETGAAQAIGEKIAKVAKTERKILFLVMLIAGVLSGFLNNSSTAAVFLTVVMGIAAASQGKIRAKNILMPLAFATNAGGMMTLIGSTPTVIVQGVLVENGAAPFGFFEFGLIGAPIFIMVLVCMMTVGYSQLRKIDVSPVMVSESAATCNGDGAAVKKTGKMKIAAGIMLLCIILFATEVIPGHLTAVLGAFLCIVTGCIPEKKFYYQFDWNTILVLAGSLGVARALEVSGAGQLIANGVLGLGFVDEPYAIFCVIIALTLIFAQIMSNTATAAMLAPIAFFIARGAGVSPYPFMAGIGALAAAGFLTPVCSPPNTMVLVGGYRFKDYIVVGALPTIAAYLLVIIFVPIIWPF
ncbi:MAG: SLC13/DASS family transporter [Firmicutes bacterium]|nr:SLC13/DASS family transporter [Bacillota bacterium]